MVVLLLNVLFAAHILHCKANSQIKNKLCWGVSYGSFDKWNHKLPLIWLLNLQYKQCVQLKSRHSKTETRGFCDDSRFHVKDLWAKYLEFLYFLVQLLQQSLPNTYTQSVPSWFHDPLQNWLELLVRGRSLTTLPRSGKVGCAVKSMQIFPCNNSKGISSG